MKIRSKLLLGFISVAVIVGVVGFIGHNAMEKGTESIKEISEVRLPSIQSLLLIMEGRASVWVAERGLVNQNMMAPDIRKSQYDYIDENFDAIEEAWNVYAPLPQTPEEAVEWDKFVKLWDEWKDDHQEVVRLSKEVDRLVATGLTLEDERPAALFAQAYEASLVARLSSLAAEEVLDKIVDINLAVAEEFKEAAYRTDANSSRLLFIFIFIGVALAIIIGLVIAGNIMSIVRSIVSQTKKLVESAVNGNLDTRANTLETNIEFREITQGINDTLDAVINPLNVAAEYVDRISKGDIPAKITDNYNGDFNEIKNNLNGCIDAVSLLVSDAKKLATAANAGQLDVRADASQHQGDFRAVVEGVNNTLDSVINPLNVAAEYIDRIAKGDIPAKITDNYNGDFNEIKNNLNLCIDSLNGLIAEMNNMSHQHDLGDIDVAIEAAKFDGAYHKMAQGVNDMVFGHIAVKKKAMACIKEFGEGNFDATLEKFPGKKAFINDTVEQVRTNLKALIIDANMLVDAAVEGKLDVRADATKHLGDFRKIVQGVNNTLDAVINPLNVAAEYVDRISKGDIPAKITDTYKGDFNEIKNNLNGCIDAVSLLVGDAKKLATAANAGQLDVRADATKHQGDFRAVVEGVNNTLDSVINPLNVAAEYIDRIAKGDIPAKITDNYNGDFNEIKNNLNLCIDSLNGLIAEMNNMSQQHDLGDIDVAIEAAKFDGAYHKMAQGVNDMVFGHITVKKKAMACIKEFGEGNFDAELEKFPGKKAFINETVEEVRKNIKGLIADMNYMSEQHDLGDIDVKIPAEKYKRDFHKMAQGVNDMVFGHIAVKKKAMACVKEFGEGNFDAELEKFPGKKVFINDTIEQVRANLKGLIADANMLVAAAVQGKLAVRAEASKHLGDFRKIVQGVNDTLDAVINPLNVAANYVDRISKGDMPKKITDNYNGDFNIIKENLNTLIDALNEITEKAQLVADGDLTVDLKKRSENDELMESLNEMVKATASIISEFQSASENISASSQQMSSTSQQISQGATEQASSAEEVSSSMEQMLANIQQNTDNAQQTEKIALNAAEGIEKVSKASNQTLKFMQEIADKISIIGEISRETNILALNAAVEAARAGEHGKGFAVVAAEVRKLAERSQISAVEIDELTKNSVKATDESSKLLEAIAPEIGKTAKLVQEIAAASIEQSSGADQVNNAIQQLNQVTQQNAAASEEMATSSEEQAGQSEQLLEMISFFKLKNDNMKGKKRDSAQKMEKQMKSGVKMEHGSNGHATKRPAPKAISKDEKKGVVIDMGKDHLDSNYETF